MFLTRIVIFAVTANDSAIANLYPQNTYPQKCPRYFVTIWPVISRLEVKNIIRFYIVPGLFYSISTEGNSSQLPWSSVLRGKIIISSACISWMDGRICGYACVFFIDGQQWMDGHRFVGICWFFQEKEVVVFLQTFFEDLFASIRSFVEPKAIASVFLWNIRL